MDVQIIDADTIVLFFPLTDSAKEWVNENLQLESWQWVGGGFAVDHKLFQDLIEGMIYAGLKLSNL